MDYRQEWNTLYNYVRGAVIFGLQHYFDDESDGFGGSELHGQFIVFKDIYDRMTVAEFGNTMDLSVEVYDDFDDDHYWDREEDITERDSEVAE